MTFLNAALAFGAAAFVVPLVIHILNRSRFKTVDWGAMHLLESVIKVNHKRLQIEQLILLLVRCCLPILLALCLARPVFTGFQALQGNAPVSLAIVLDNSYSMDALESSGDRYSQAVAAACEMIEATARGSEIAVIQTGGQPTPLFDRPTFDSEAAIRKLKQQRSGFGASDIPAAIDEAFVTLAGMSHARRELFVISDFQPADWEQIGVNPTAISEQVEASTIEPELSLLAIGTASEGNISVDDLEFTTRPLGVGQTLDVRAIVRNHGSRPVDSARAVFRVDGVEESVSSISLSADGTTQVLFPYEFAKAGSHVIDVEVLADDPLQTDNRLHAAINVWDSIRVLLIDGDPSQEPLKGETDFLSVALTPYSFGRVRLTDLVETQTVRAGDFKEEHLDGTRLVVLANVSKLRSERLELLDEYVRNGGSLLVTAGDKIDLRWYRESMFADGKGLLPLPFAESVGSIDGSGSTAKIVSQRFEHPAFTYFNDAAHGDLSTAEIRRWYKLGSLSETTGSDSTESVEDDGGESADRSNVRVAVKLDSGDPLFVEKTYGDGVVMQMTTSCDADWTNLPLRPVYLPMMQQLATTLASRISPPRNIATGESAVALLPDVEGPSTVTVTSPNGRQNSVQTTARGDIQVAQFDNTQRPGVYAMALPQGETIHFVAETSRNESKPEILSPDDVDNLAQAIGAQRFTSIDRYLEQDRLRRHGREIWKLILAAFLGLLLLEVVLQQRFARVSA